MLENKKDWTALPPELIQIVAKKLPDLLDFVRFRATCKTWRSSAPLSDPPPQLPWFIELLDGGDEPHYGIISERHRYYSVSSCQILTIQFSRCGTLWKWMKAGVFSHYLPFASRVHQTLSFFNPLTRVQYTLRSPSFYRQNPWIIWTGTDPICDRTIVTVQRDFSHKHHIGGWSCYNPHSEKWTEQGGYFNNSCYWQGMLFLTNAENTTEVFDVSTEKLLHKIPPPKDDLTCLLEKSYLVMSLGKILRVSWIYDWPEGIVEESTFYIYRLEFDGLDGQPCWVRVHNIGNQILFLEEMTGFSMTARPSIGFREGCIYFIDPDDNKPYEYDILAGTVERVPCPFKRCTWFVPSLSMFPWTLWKHRNDICFQRASHKPARFIILLTISLVLYWTGHKKKAKMQRIREETYRWMPDEETIEAIPLCIWLPGDDQLQPYHPQEGDGDPDPQQ